MSGWPTTASNEEIQVSREQAECANITVTSNPTVAAVKQLENSSVDM